jgi:signal transduction histidine kinase
MSPPASRRLAWLGAWLGAWLAGCLVAAGLLLSIFAFVASNGGTNLPPHEFFNPLITLTFSSVGALVASRHPRNPIGWILIATGFLSALDLLGVGYQLYSTAVMPIGSLPGDWFASWLENWLWLIPVTMPFTFLVLLFPDGRPLSPRWRPVAWAVGVGLAGVVLVYASSPEVGALGGWIPGGPSNIVEVLNVLGSASAILLIAGMFGSLTSLIVRFRRSRGVLREQLKWLVYAVGLAFFTAVLGNVLAAILPGGDPLQLSIISIGIAVMMIITAIGIAIVRHHLYDIDLLINRTLVYGALTVLIAGIYILVVGLLGSLFQARGEFSTSLVATGVVAIGFQPLRERLQRVINRLMYGERDDPFAVLSRLGERLEGAFAPDALLVMLVDTIAQSLKLPYVAIALGSQAETRIAASVGEPIIDPEQFSLIFQREIFGQLLVGPRAAGEKFNLPERHLLANIARQAGTAVHAMQLAVDLQRSRVQLVTAREEERRRLRRDLHDGLGPTLAALHLQAGTVRRLMRKEPDTAESIVDDLKVELKGLLEDIRRLAYELRPPALDELGLVGAIQSLSTRIRKEDDGSHDVGSEQQRLSEHEVTIQASGDMRSLPAAVEVAAYHIVQEALLNSMRHARASQYVVRLDRSESLTLEIVDNGQGLPPRYHAGVGMLSMRERAAELGGWCSVESPPEGGTVVHALIPVLEL